jgi:hypothetical protein
MAELSTPEYDRFADEARQQVAQAQAVTAAYQGLARRLLEGAEVDVTVGEPSSDA